MCGPISKEVASANANLGLDFEEHQANLTKEPNEIEQEMGRWLCLEGATAQIEGHADKADPQDLALQRAQVVWDTLVKLGVPQSRSA